ncbi:MAG: hypothetical protein M3R00_09245, partial [Pseudomonadota bacterium]|nr:hypothetical protein [Pseudomonadota bacterium]
INPASDNHLSTKAKEKHKSYGRFVHATNHFINTAHRTHFLVEHSETRWSSKSRFNAMHAALDAQECSKVIAAKGCSEDTVQSMRFAYDSATKVLKLTATWGNYECAKEPPVLWGTDAYKAEFAQIKNVFDLFKQFHQSACVSFYPNEVNYVCADDESDEDSLDYSL